MKLEYSALAATDPGPRGRNEDAHVCDTGNGIFIVADGMGKHANGDVASRLAVQTVHQKLQDSGQIFQMLQRLDSPATRSAAVSAMERALSGGCQAVYDESMRDPTSRGMGTTCIAVVVSGHLVVVGHVGDSRAYLSRAGDRLHQLTEDHTLVAAQLKARTITPEEAAVSPFRHVLVRALGIQSSVEVDATLIECTPGDILFACTDGLYGALPEGGLQAVLKVPFTQTHLQRLMMAAKPAATDNFTGIALCFAPAPQTAETTLTVNKVDALKRVPLFTQFDYREKAAVLNVGAIEQVAAGSFIVREGEQGKDLYVVVRGKVAVSKGGEHLRELGPGDHFGELVLLDDAPRSASVGAVEPSVVLRFDKDALFNLMRSQPDLGLKFAWALAEGLAQRLRATNESFQVARTSNGYRIPGFKAS